jgi:hypothetical protein
MCIYTKQQALGIDRLYFFALWDGGWHTLRCCTHPSPLVPPVTRAHLPSRRNGEDMSVS